MTATKETLLSSDDTRNLVELMAEGVENNISVILGAGASFDYTSNLDVPKPPVVKGLFDPDNNLVYSIMKGHDLIRKESTHINKMLKGRFQGDLEAYLNYLYEKDDDDNLFPSVLLYLQDIFRIVSQSADLEGNNFQTLISLLRELRGKRPWSFISFNYDTILEQSIMTSPRLRPTRRFEGGGDYTIGRPEVVKVHGGINFRYKLVGKETGTTLTRHEVFTEMMNDQRSPDTYLEVLSPRVSPTSFKVKVELDGLLLPQYDLPLMMIPIHGSAHARNLFFAQQIQRAKKELENSSLVIAIGYNFGDDLFLSALQGSNLLKSRLILVGSERLLEKQTEHPSFEKASKIWPKENISIFNGEGFGSFVESLYL